jgi:hypothetical protein
MQHPDESGQTNLILTQSREVAKEPQSIFHGFPLLDELFRLYTSSLNTSKIDLQNNKKINQKKDIFFNLKNFLLAF